MALEATDLSGCLQTCFFYEPGSTSIFMPLLFLGVSDALKLAIHTITICEQWWQQGDTDILKGHVCRVFWKLRIGPLKFQEIHLKSLCQIYIPTYKVLLTCLYIYGWLYAGGLVTLVYWLNNVLFIIVIYVMRIDWASLPHLLSFPVEHTWANCTVAMCNNNNIAWSTSRHCIRDGDRLRLQLGAREQQGPQGNNHLNELHFSALLSTNVIGFEVEEKMGNKKNEPFTLNCAKEILERTQEQGIGGKKQHPLCLLHWQKQTNIHFKCWPFHSVTFWLKTVDFTTQIMNQKNRWKTSRVKQNLLGKDESAQENYFAHLSPWITLISDSGQKRQFLHMFHSSAFIFVSVATSLLARIWQKISRTRTVVVNKINVSVCGAGGTHCVCARVITGVPSMHTRCRTTSFHEPWGVTGWRQHRSTFKHQMKSLTSGKVGCQKRSEHFTKSDF